MSILQTPYALARKLLFGFVKFRIHLSMIFYFLLLYNNYRTGYEIDMELILSFSFWHFALFLFDRVYDRKIDQEAQPDEYVKDHLAIPLYIVVALCMAASLVLYIPSGYPITYWLILFPITFLYPLRVIGNKRFKDFFLIKNLYSAVLIFSLPLFIQAYLTGAMTIPTDEVLYPIMSLAIYVMIGEIFWDIRDTSVDLKNGTRSLPNTIGLWPTKYMLIAALVADILFRWDVGLSAVVYLVLLIFVHEKSDRLVFHLPPLIALARFLL